MKYEVRAPEDLGAAIADRRRDLGKTQSALATEVGLSQRYLSQIETGRTNLATQHTFRLLRRLGATITITFDGEAT